MGEPWFPDPARSRAVLIGVGRYRSVELPAIPAVRDNVRDLHAALTDPAGGTLPDNGCVRLGEASEHARVGTAVATAAAQARDLLLVYYAGHGVLDRDGKLHLALGSTDPDHLAWTAIPHDLIRRELGRSRAKARVLILDCCFSGRAVEAMSGPGSLVAGQLKVTGTFTLTSTTATEPAHAPLGERHTAFTGALLRALASPKPLTLDDIYRHTEDELTGLGLPSPQCQSVNTARDVALIRVPPPPRTLTPPPPSPPPQPKPQKPETKPGSTKANRPASRPKPKAAQPTSSTHITKASPPTPKPTADNTSTPAMPPSLPRPSLDYSKWTTPEPARPSTRWPRTKALVSATLCVASAIIAWIMITDPFRNVGATWFEQAVGALFGAGMAVFAVFSGINAMKLFGQARNRNPSRRRTPR